MKNLLTIALGGLLVSFAFAGSAEACHKKACKPSCAPAPVACVAPAPVCVEPAPVACAPAPKKCHFKLPQMPKLNCHFKLPKCKGAAPVACAETVVYAAPAPVYAAPQASAQN